MNNTAPSFEASLDKFFAAAQAIVDREYATFGGTPHGPKLEIERGRRYVKIISVSHGQRSAWAFVDSTNGDVLKADGWSRPAKGARGCIYDNQTGTGRVRWTGVR
jgi:hypothetical protein